MTDQTITNYTMTAAGASDSASPRGLALLVTTAWEKGELAVLRDLLETAVESAAPRVTCPTSAHEEEIAEMVAASLRTIANWIRQPVASADMDLQVALGMLKHLGKSKPASFLM